MGYYKKQDILDYVSENIKEIEAKGLRSLNPESEVIKRLNDEEDMVGFFWIDYEGEENQGQKIKFEGRSWYRISSDLYTDDRFAIDLYQAMINGINVTDVINKREQDKELAKQGIVDINTLEEKVKENIDKENGTE
ncbi:MAG: hypothetical protein AABY15_04125 [Nanoarchaeota archaeon]